VIADGIETSLLELLAAARGGRPTAEREPAATAARAAVGPSPVLPSGRHRTQRGPAADMRAKRSRGAQPSRKRSTGGES
jgi:hypothetical protein